jgi:hypothetical protein
MCCSESVGPSFAPVEAQDLRIRRSLVWDRATGSLDSAEACCCSGRRDACFAPAEVEEAWVYCTALREAHWVGGCWGRVGQLAQVQRVC